jgi:hypothetical protein
MGSRGAGEKLAVLQAMAVQRQAWLRAEAERKAREAAEEAAEAAARREAERQREEQRKREAEAARQPDGVLTPNPFCFWSPDKSSLHRVTLYKWM